MINSHSLSCNQCLCLRSVRASDKRITCDEEFSDSEDEGEGGRRHLESFKHKRIRLDADKITAEGKLPATTDKSLSPSLLYLYSAIHEWRGRFNKLGERKLQFSSRCLQIFIVSHSKFYSKSQLFPKWGFLTQNFVFFEQNYHTQQKFSDRLNFKGVCFPCCGAIGVRFFLQVQAVGYVLVVVKVVFRSFVVWIE